MTEIQTVFEFIKDGGAMAIIVIVAYALTSGRLRLSREIERADKQIADCAEELKIYRDQLLRILERQQTILEELKRDLDRNSRG